MSDKHTDAQGELACPFCGAAAKVHGAYKSWSVNCSGCDAYGAAAETSDEAIVKWNRRATEGQAQTSAAIHVLHSPAEPSWNEQREQLQAKVIESALDLAEHTGCMGFSVPISGTTPQISVSLAAQLADSTAPDAPVVAEIGDPLMLSEHAFSSPLCYRLYKSEIACYRMAMKLAAPTAQQSLTAGGAVPEVRPAGYINPASFLKLALGEVAEIYPVESGGDGKTTVYFAAAPLPQVQSKALDRDAIELAWYSGYYHAGYTNDCAYAHMKAAEYAREVLPSKTGVTHSGNSNRPLRDASKQMEDCQFFLGEFEAAKATYDYADANQQPVTPSGALADNDGGVAK